MYYIPEHSSTPLCRCANLCLRISDEFRVYFILRVSYRTVYDIPERMLHAALQVVANLCLCTPQHPPPLHLSSRCVCARRGGGGAYMLLTFRYILLTAYRPNGR
jgi:hypothetical protein